MPSVGGRELVCWGDEEVPPKVTPLAMTDPSIGFTEALQVYCLVIVGKIPPNLHALWRPLPSLG